MNAALREGRSARGRSRAWPLLGALLLLVSASSSALASETSLTAASSGSAALSPSAQKAADRVELNSADVEELCTLPGIGPKKAEAIIAYREQRRFTRVTQLLRIRGIGMKTLERLRPLIYVAPLSPRPGAAGGAASEKAALPGAAEPKPNNGAPRALPPLAASGGKGDPVAPPRG